MDLFNSLIRTLVGGFCSLFGDTHPLVSLTPVSVLTGIAMLWVFGRASDQKAIAETKRRLQAYLLELRLFGDDLSLVWKTQKNLLAGNVRYIGLMMKPAVVVILPILILLLHLDAFYGMAPLPVGQPTVVTVQSSYRLTSNTPTPQLQAPRGISVDTPAVRALETGQFSWRIRPTQKMSGELRFEWEGRAWEKSIAAGSERQYLSHRRAGALLDRFWYPGEDGISAEGIEWVEVRYPAAGIEVGGIELHWLIWFFVISMVAAFALRRHFKVVF